MLEALICAWNNPGSNPTTAPVEKTVAGYELKASAEMIRKIKAGEYDELVVVSKGEGRMQDMSFGAKGGICKGAVDTSGWKAGHVEHGRVFRVGSEALIWFWRCKNLARWQAVPMSKVYETAGGPAPVYLPVPVVALGVAEPVAFTDAPLAPLSVVEAARIQPVYFPPYQPGPVILQPAPTPAVPDVPASLSLALGLLVIAFIAKRS